MNLALITKTEIIEKIFSLVCNKLNLTLIIKDDLNFEDKVDFIFIDEEFINDDFNSLKSHTKKLAAITSEELPFDKSRDFILQRPFLPKVLEELLHEQIEFLKEDEKEEQETLSSNRNDSFIEDEEAVITNYVESLAEDVAFDIEEESDESIITLASLKDGGILDGSELGKITEILHDDDIQNQVNVDENDWKDISEIIDDALSEVNDYEFDVNLKNEPVKLVLNNYNIDELKPFLMKFNQGVIDRLSNGEEVDIKMSLRQVNNG